MMHMITCNLVKGGNGNTAATIIVCVVLVAFMLYIIAKEGK